MYSVTTGVLAATGGIVLGIVTSLHYILYGRLTGASGFMETAFKTVDEKSDHPHKKDWHITFLIGINHASTIWFQTNGGLTLINLPLYFFAIGGVLVGFGTRLGSGCTSGHGISGLSRLSLRSFAAVGTFMAAAIVTANLLHNTDLHHDFGSAGVLTDSQWYESSEYLAWPVFVYGMMYLLKQFSFETCVLWALGALFGVGLCLGGMVNNAVVLNFLTFDYNWDPSLAFVLGFSLIVFTPVYWYRHFNNSEPFYAKSNTLPINTELDKKLIAGASLFGIGWGVAGVCPAPAAATLSVPVVSSVFLPGLFLGMKLQEAVASQGMGVAYGASTKSANETLSDDAVGKCTA